MKLTTAIIVFASTIANANGKRGIRRALVSEQDSYYSMSMPAAVDADAMKGGTSGKSGKEPPVGAVEVVSDADDGPGSLREALRTGATGGTLTLLIDKRIKKIDISTMNEQEMKELLQTMLKTAPNDAIKQGVQEQIDKINKNK